MKLSALDARENKNLSPILPFIRNVFLVSMYSPDKTVDYSWPQYNTHAT